MTRTGAIRQLAAKDGDVFTVNYMIGVTVPYILADMAYSEYNKEIRKLPLKKEIKRLRNKWTQENALYFANIRTSVSSEVMDELISLMNEFEEEFRDIFTVIKVQIMNSLNNIPFEHQKVLAAAHFCNLMYQEANVYYGWKHQKVHVSDTPVGRYLQFKEKDEPYFIRARDYSKDFANMYYEPFHAGFVRLIDNEELNRGLDALENRIIMWVKNGYQSESEA